MIKILKKVFYFLLILIFPLLTYTNNIEELSYRNGTLKIKFTKTVSSYNETYDNNNPSLLLSFKQTTFDSKKVPNRLQISDNYLSDILTDGYENNTNIVIYMQTGTKYTIEKKAKELIIKFQDAVHLPKRNYTIVLDAGHGGKDSGAVGNGYREKDIALDVVLKLYQNLKRDYKVILTRDSDFFVPLNTRAKIGNDAKADLFVSIHLNSATNKVANGSEVFYFSKNPSSYARELSKYENSFDQEGARIIEASQFVVEDILYNLNQQQSASLANTVLNNIVRTMQLQRRRVAGANFAVLRGSLSPSILIELGFMSNVDDVLSYTSEAGQIKAANAIAEAIRKHY
ncbi:N-acetylmuramoyl-L-alanine amidase family protein [Caviibacter abscessus]|uniref:N-acetylmuramoyl-L-alanine amidase family protein n=1 Tax=Caviibacter abscessus TaxID=1766719 RepID=UPI00083529EE|nr:N-acetylmuramoyl-L-alanine amidase [Caviibacter abscessus]